MEKLDPKDIENILALTPLQEGILFHYLQALQSELYFEQLILEISGPINIHFFERAWNIIIETNEMLRTVFRWEKLDKPSQIVLKVYKCNVIFHDLSDKDSGQKKTAFEEIKNKDRRETFDLHQIPFRVILCKLDETKYRMVISNHHILYDGWSNGIILKEFFKAYHALHQGGQSLKTLVKPPFKDFIKWIQSQDRNKQEQFWSEYLAGFETPAELPIKRRKQETPGAGDYSIILEEDIKSKLDVFVKNNRIPLAPVFYTAWGVLLQRYCSSEDVIFGTTVSGRSGGIKGIEDMVGLFINTIPLRIQTTLNEKINDVVLQIEQVLREREEFENTPLVDIRSCCSVSVGGLLFDTIVVIENYPLDNRLLREDSLLSIHSYSMVETPHYDLSVCIMPSNEIEIKFSFKKELFEKETIENLAGHFKAIIQKMIENPETKLFQLEIISIEEKNRILYEFNNTATEYPRDKTIHQLFEAQATRTPDRIAVFGRGRIWTKVEEKKRRREEEKNVGAAPCACPARNARNISLTYSEFNERADRLAGFLIGKGALPDTIVGIMMERSVEMIVGIVGILKSGGMYLPIDPDYPQERIDYILKDSGTKLLVTTNDKEGEKGKSWEGEIYYTDELLRSSYLLTFFPSYLQNSSNLAYIIYTSGSTGKPKGVLIENRSVINFIKGITDIIPFQESDRILSLTTISFDIFGLETILSLTKGAAVIIGNSDEQQDASLGALVIAREAITIFQVTPSRLQLFLQAPESGLNLKRLKYLLVGGEVFPEALLAKLKPLTGGSIYNVYGPTETTIWSTLKEVGGGNILNIGNPLANTFIYMLSRGGLLQPVGVAGEICISGEGVARGYTNRPELTKEKFPGNPFVKGGRLYYTGDIGRWLPNGNIECLGRLDHQIKLRGVRIELGEIENLLLKHDRIKGTVMVVNADETGDKILTAYFVSDIELSYTELREYLLKYLPDYMIPSNFVRLEKIPLTPSGKVDHRALPAAKVKEITTYVAPRNEIEMKLGEIWAGILGRNKSLNRIGIDDNFFQLGGHSLKATILVLKIHKTFYVNVPMTEIFRTPTIRDLSNYIKLAVKVRHVSIDPAEKKEYYPMSSAQKRMYIEQQMQLDSKSYNIPAISTLEGEISFERLTNAFQQLIKRHESLRTSFAMIRREGVQLIHEHVEFNLEYYEREEENSLEIVENFLNPFDLSKAPLLRVGLIKISETKHLLMVDMHHIISDGVSHQILEEEFKALYSGENLPPMRFQYKDFSEWQNRLFEAGFIKKQEEYWLNRYKDNIPILNLPTDYPKPSSNISNKGDSINFYVEEKLSRKLYEILKSTGNTVYTFLLAAYNILLSKFTGQADIIVVSPITGRRHNDLENIIGMFVNMLAMRNQPEGEKSFREFLEEVKTNLLDAYENQDYQFPELTGRLNLQGHMNKNPLLNTVFTMQNIDIKKIDLTPSTPTDSLKIVFYKYDRKISAFDLHLIASEGESDGRINLSIEYSIELFKESTIRDISKHYLEIIEMVIQNPDIQIKDIRFSSNLLALKQKEITDGKDFGF